MYDALILGGGPAGAGAAIHLANAGWSVALVEKSHFPRRKVCGEFISAPSLAILDALGVGDDFRAQAGPEIREAAIFSGNGISTAPMPKGSEEEWGRALGREHLDLLLLERARTSGADIFQPWKAEDLQRSNDGFACRIERKGETRTLRARIVVAAQGSWAPGLLNSDYPHRDDDLFAFKAHFQNADLPAHRMPLIAFPGGYGGMVRSDGGRVSFSCCIRRDTLARARTLAGGSAGEGVLSWIAESCAGVRDALHEAARDGLWLSAGPIRPGIRRRYHNGIFFAGNAAGEAHPIVAEGISMALQSASLLRAYLTGSGGRHLDAAGEAYSAAWLRAFEPRIRASMLLAHIAMRPGLAGAASALCRRFPQIITKGARFVGKVTPAPGSERVVGTR